MILRADNYLINLIDFISITNNRENNTIVVVNDMFNYLIKINEHTLSEDIFESVVYAMKSKDEFYEIDMKYVDEVVQGYFEVMGEI